LSSVIVNGDNNLVSGNIKSGVSIFGVNGELASDSFFCFSDEMSSFTLSNKKISISASNAFSGYRFMTFNYYCRNFNYEEDSVVVCSISNQYGSRWFGYYGATSSTYVEIISARDDIPFTASISDSLIEVEIVADSSFFFQTPSMANGLIWITLFN
jgi:hypothetical protein